MRSVRPVIAALLLLGLSAVPAVAQGTSADSIMMQLSASKRSGVTRAELQASLTEIDKVLASGGYSGAIKSMKRDEAALIRQRLAEGDLRPGDAIMMAVASDPSLTTTYVVTPARTIIIPSIGAIPVDGILRSEVEAHLQKALSKYLRDPVVLAEALINIGAFGGVGRQGYFNVRASDRLSDVVMNAAGGLQGSANVQKSTIKRADREIVSEDAFTVALREGRTLDQLNMQAGDEIHVGLTTQTTTKRIIAGISGAASLTYLLIRIF